MWLVQIQRVMMLQSNKIKQVGLKQLVTFVALGGYLCALVYVSTIFIQAAHQHEQQRVESASTPYLPRHPSGHRRKTPHKMYREDF